MPDKVIDCFGHFRPKIHVDKVTRDVIHQFDLKLDKETGNTSIVEVEPVDVNELVGSYASVAGMAYARKLIQTGQVSPNAFADDGQHSADIVGMPDNIYDASQAAAAAKVKGDAVAASLGLGSDYVSKKDLDSLIKQKVDALLAAQNNPAENKEVK